MRVVAVGVAVGAELHVRADAGVFVDDRVLDTGAGTDPEVGSSALHVIQQLVFAFVEIGAHHDHVLENRAGPDEGTHAEHAVENGRVLDDRAVAEDGVVDLALIDLRRRQVTVLGVDRRTGIEEVERRQRLGEREVGVEERLHRADVLPVALKNMGVEFFRAQQARDDLLTEVGHGVVQCVGQGLAVKNVNTHRGQAVLFARRIGEEGLHRRGEGEAVDDLRVLRLLHELSDGKIVVHPHQAQALDFRNGKGDRRDGHVRAGRDVLVDDFLEIHPVELVARKDEHEVVREVAKMLEIAAHRVGRALIPVLALLRLLGGEDVHEAAAKRIEVKGVLDVPVQRSGVELGQQKDAVDRAVDAVADRDIDEAILAGERHRRLAPLLGERMQTRAATAAHDDSQNILFRGHG